MAPSAGDTIAAIATAAGPAAIGIVRISGPEARAIGETLCGRALAPRYAHHCRFRDPAGNAIDAGVAIFFQAPASFTGEDVVELQGHGSPMALDALLEQVCLAGARPAQPGEFSLRAFLNDKLDLVQAEAIADLIGAGSRAAATAAVRSLQGRFSVAVAALQAGLTELRVIAEAWLDFPEEDLDAAVARELEPRLDASLEALDGIIRDAGQGLALSDGLQLAIAGAPNAGKSSLLNRLTGTDAAIVTDIPGTTRDSLHRRIVVEGLPVGLVDTAGLRETDDIVETAGVARARAEITQADHVLWVSDVRDGPEAALAAAAAALEGARGYSVVLNKLDLTGRPAKLREHGGIAVVELSALTGTGLELLGQLVLTLAGRAEAPEGSFSARRRHLTALETARRHLTAAAPLLGSELELAAEELRAAQAALAELTGELTSDDLLGQIFSSFCIGK